MSAQKVAQKSMAQKIAFFIMPYLDRVPCLGDCFRRSIPRVRDACLLVEVTHPQKLIDFSQRGRLLFYAVTELSLLGLRESRRFPLPAAAETSVLNYFLRDTNGR